MLNLVVVDSIKNFPLDLDGVQVIEAKDYILNKQYALLRNVRVYNLCQSYRYQSLGYYVSLLAQARSHKILPTVSTINELKATALVKLVSEDLEKLIEKSLYTIKRNEFILSIYFAKNLAKQYAKLSQAIFNYFPAPLLRASFQKRHNKWQLRTVRTISLSDVPMPHIEQLENFANSYFAKKRFHSPKKQEGIYDLAILYDENEKTPPSDKKAIQKFINAAESLGFSVDLIDKDDFNKIPSYDALFIRETTAVNHHTYRFAQRAKADGIVVMDDPESILKCTNKGYITDLLVRDKIPVPNTLMVCKGSEDLVMKEIGFPCVLKQPDSSFSFGVSKANNEEELRQKLTELWKTSELVIAQEFLRTDFDWRIGVLDGKPLFACKYYMARDHWQIYNWAGRNGEKMGAYECLAVEDVPHKVVDFAMRAASAMGDGLYGVDLKELNGKVYVIEVNDNPSIDEDVEDQILGDELYFAVMRVFLDRILKKKARTNLGNK